MIASGKREKRYLSLHLFIHFYSLSITPARNFLLLTGVNSSNTAGSLPACRAKEKPGKSPDQGTIYYAPASCAQVRRGEWCLMDLVGQLDILLHGTLSGPGDPCQLWWNHCWGSCLAPCFPFVLMLPVGAKLGKRLFGDGWRLCSTRLAVMVLLQKWWAVWSMRLSAACPDEYSVINDFLIKL